MADSSQVLKDLDALLNGHRLRKVLVCGKQTVPPPLSYVVNFPRLELPLSGNHEMRIEIDGRQTLVAPGPGTAVFAPPNCWNEPTWARPARVMSILFGKKQVGISVVTAQGGSMSDLRADKLSLRQPLTGPAERILFAMLELQAGDRPYHAFPELVTGLLHALRAVVTAPAESGKSKGHGMMEEICVFIQQNYRSNVTRDSTAAEFGFTPNHLSRLFKLHGSMTFHDYLAYVRIDRAKYLLKTYRPRVEEVAAQCGFSDSAHFCRVFRRLARCTPSEYRDGSLGGSSVSSQAPAPADAQTPPARRRRGRQREAA
jgi:AraC-like DNA-binding protein